MDMENANTGGNETPKPSPEEKIKEIQVEIKKTSKNIAVCPGVLYVCGFVFRRKKERIEQIGAESPQSMTEMQTERKTDEKSSFLKRKHVNPQGKRHVRPEVCLITARGNREAKE